MHQISLDFAYGPSSPSSSASTTRRARTGAPTISGASLYATTSIEPADAKSGFSCGKHALDDYFARHAVTNDAAGVGRAYVLRRGPDDPATLPVVLGFYTLSMAVVESVQIAQVLARKLPKYPMPVDLTGYDALIAEVGT